MNRISWLLAAVLLPHLILGSAFATCIGSETDTQLCETAEVLFDSGDALSIKQKAQALATPVAIYEYLRNHTRYSVYHGARSSSVNAFLGLQGNDVDLASTLIAMYRALGIKARYATGNIRLKRSDLANWVQVENTDLAVAILGNQGINVVDESQPDTVVFEHVWAEALVNFGHYRGALAPTSTCTAETDQCLWVALDPSFKFHKFKPQYRNLLASVGFDYDAYYHAETNQNLRDKSPLEIFEENALAYLRANHPGVTLQDVIDDGEIIQEELGLLPASLPYEVVGNVQRYDSVAEQTTAGVLDAWDKTVQITVNPIVGGAVCDTIAINGVVSVADLSTKRLTVNWSVDGAVSKMSLRLDGSQIGGALFGGISFTCNGSSETFNEGSRFQLTIQVDASPFDAPVEVIYENLMAGGYYLVATGGETSNRSQVRRATEQLLAANQQYPLVTNAQGEVIVDANNNGIAEASESLLLEDQVAQDSLTGGLLYVAQAQYYALLKEAVHRYSRMKNVVAPISAFVGIVSTTYEVEVVDETPFAVLPGGLLIDLKGISFNGTFKADEAETFSNETFRFIGHVVSALEHEIWQELVGYDAVSTMRGIQFALAGGETLLDIFSTTTQDTFEASLLQMGVPQTPPSDFTQDQYDLFGRAQVTWNYSGSDPANAVFRVFRGDVSEFGLDDLRASIISWSATNGIGAFIACYDTQENDLLALPPSATIGTGADCRGNSLVGMTVSQALAHIEQTFNTHIADLGIEDFINFLDKNQGFDPALVFYHNNNIGLDDYDFESIRDIRSLLYATITQGGEPIRMEFMLPSALTLGPTYAFEVSIRDRVKIASDQVIGTQYLITNRSNRLVAGGGYVPEGEPVDPATDTEGVSGSGEQIDISGVTFNNEAFTDQNLVSIANNDVIRTPSTIDPVATATGNMYHDETDLVIPGKGLPYAFTRTYNSNQTSTDGPGSANPNYLPFSRGWTHSYNMKLVANDYGRFPNYGADLAPENANNLTSSISYVDERGGESNYLLSDASNTSQPTSPRAGFDDLVLDSPSAGLHSITFNNGVIYTFDSLGGDIRVPGTVAVLSQIKDPVGNELNFAYTNGQLTSITDNIGQTQRTGLTLTYYSSGVNASRLETVADWTGRVWEYRYTNGQLSEVLNPLNESMTYTYAHDPVTDTDLLSEIIHPQSRGGQQRSMLFNYYENGRAYNYTDQLGNEESLIYDLFRRRTRVTNPRGFVTEHHYDENGALVKLKEPDNGLLLFENNEDGLRYLKYNALGHATRYSYHTSKEVTGIASDTQGQVTREQDALGHTIDTDYGIFNQPTVIKDKNGNTFTTEYYTASDPQTDAVIGRPHRRLAQTATVNGVTHSNVVLEEYTYFPDGNFKQRIQHIDPAQPTKKRITDYVYTYAADGSYTVTITATGSGQTITTQQSFDALWRLTSSTSTRRTSATDATPLALTTSYEYDDLGRVIRTTDPIGNISETVFDQNGQVSQTLIRYKLLPSGNSPLHPECTVDPAFPNHHSCVQSTNTYDLADRLLSTTDVLGATTTFAYNEMGDVVKITNHLGNSLSYTYDPKGRRTSVTDENGYKVKTEYDLAGRVTSVTDPNKNKITYTYDALGRTKTITSPEGRQTVVDEIDGNGNVIKLRDANGIAETQPLNSEGSSIFNEFDEFNRLRATLNANNEETRYQFDLLGNRTQVIDAESQVTEFVYDDLGRMTQVIDPIIESPNDKTVLMTFDETGNRLTYTDRLGEVTRTTYDSLNRPVLQEYLADGVTMQHQYDQYGDLVSLSHGGSTYTYTYDAAHRLTSKTDSRDNRTMSWNYDLLGNVIKKTNYQGIPQTFTYNSSNRLISMAAGDPVYLQASYHHDPAGRLLSRILSNGAATTYEYSPDNFLKSIRHIGADGELFEILRFERDEVGNITQRIINGPAPAIIDYQYDPAYRLLNADSSTDAHDRSFTYDKVGNRLSKTVNGNTHHYLYATGNRLTEIRANSPTGPLVNQFIYDDNGSLITRLNGNNQPELQLEYDQRRLASNIGVDGTPNTATFQYDPNAYRIEKQNSLETKQYFLEAEHLESIYDENNELQAHYLRGAIIDELINGFEKNTEGDLENITYHHDQINSITSTTNHNGEIQQRKEYSAFGETLNHTGTTFNRLNYTGRELDWETDLYYYRARYYDPEIGRFISEDPIGFEGGINFYAYVNNNPLVFNDPSGNRLVGVEAGGSGCALICFGADSSIVLDTETLEIGFSTTREIGGGFATSGFGSGDLTVGIIRGSAGAQMSDLEGSSLESTTSLNVSATAGAFVSINGPLVSSDRFDSGDDIHFVTIGYAIGNQGTDLNVTRNDSTLNTTSRLRDTVNGGIELINDLSSALGYDDPIDYRVPSSGSNSTGASGGFVIYPSRINSNFSNRNAYSKGD